jgi:polyvinyl alcohol dehydrogenase (cytochrome)
MTYRLCGVIAAALCLPPAGVSGQPAQAGQAPPLTPQRIFETTCMTCHGNPKVEQDSRTAIATPSALRLMPAERLYVALASGTPHVQGRQLTDAQRRGVAEYLAGRNLTTDRLGEASRMPNLCASNPPIRSLTQEPAWNGWSPEAGNGRLQSARAAGLTPAQVPRLRLKWAFGLPEATQVYGQPSVVAGRVFVAGNTGYVYSVDAGTGCVYWSFQALSAVRTATTVGPVTGQGTTRFAAFFGDQRATIYAVDATNGRLLWKTRVDEHGLAGITGAPALNAGRLYVPVSSREEPAGVATVYPCCTFRGSIVALDSSSGRQIWKTSIIPEEPKPAGKNVAGTELWAPSGAAIWNTPTIDPGRRALYIGTGNSTSRPAANTTDAVMAMDLDTGRVLWTVQDTLDDAWLAGCGNSATPTNCPQPLGPDYDFGASPILRSLSGNRRILVAGQKSGVVWGHDPDRKGEVVWKIQLPQQMALGEITFGGAADERLAYFGLRSGGIAAVDLATGKRVWFTPLPGREARAGQTAALTLIPGVVFSGGWDGVLRALSSTDGTPLWDFDMKRDFATVNGVRANGGAMGSSGPTVAGGMLFVGSGYVFGGISAPGNVLLAFSAQ